MSLHDTLQHIFLFDTLNDKDIQLVASFCSLRHLSKGEHIFHEGDTADAFFAVVSGKVKIYKLSPDGQEYILAIQGKGHLVAEAAIFDQETYPAYCQGLEDTTLVRIPKDDFIQLILKHADIALKILHAYSKRLRYFVMQVEELSLRDIKSRLAKYINENSMEYNGQTVCRLSISKKELAALLGTIPETLSRTLKYYKDENIIQEREQDILILNSTKLRAHL